MASKNKKWFDGEPAVVTSKMQLYPVELTYMDDDKIRFIPSASKMFNKKDKIFVDVIGVDRMTMEIKKTGKTVTAVSVNVDGNSIPITGVKERLAYNSKLKRFKNHTLTRVKVFFKELFA